MLEYEWGGNPSTIILSSPGEETPSHDGTAVDPNRHFYHPGNSAGHSFNGQEAMVLENHHPSSALYHNSQLHNPHQLSTFYNPRVYNTTQNSIPSFISQLAPSPTAGYFLVPKAEDPPTDHYASRMGLNLGGRTYFSSTEDDFVNRLYRRPRPLVDPSGSASSSAVINAPRCQAEGCNADLTNAKHYHRRHKVCEFHSKASTVIAHGLTQRFCQQCSRFHLLAEFDNGKRSCRKRLADHNRRRRKSNHAAQEMNRQCKSPRQENERNSPSEILHMSPPHSGVHSASSVTVALSPPRMSLDCFKQRQYHTGHSTNAPTSTSSSSFFFASG